MVAGLVVAGGLVGSVSPDNYNIQQTICLHEVLPFFYLLCSCVEILNEDVAVPQIVFVRRIVDLKKIVSSIASDWVMNSCVKYLRSF